MQGLTTKEPFEMTEILKILIVVVMIWLHVFVKTVYFKRIILLHRNYFNKVVKDRFSLLFLVLFINVAFFLCKFCAKLKLKQIRQSIFWELKIWWWWWRSIQLHRSLKNTKGTESGVWGENRAEREHLYIEPITY